MTKRGTRRSPMNTSVPTIIVDARLASFTKTSATRTNSTSPTSRSHRSDNGTIGTISTLGSISPNAHLLAALRLAADRKVLRAPGSLRRRLSVLPRKQYTSRLHASQIASRITTRRCLSGERQSDALARAERAYLACKHVCRHSNSPKISGKTGNAADAVRVSRSKPRDRDVDNLDSEFTKNKDRHSSAAGKGNKAIKGNDWPLLQAAAQEILTAETKKSAPEPQLSDADLKEAIQLLKEKRAREQKELQQQGEQQKKKQLPMTSGGGVRPKWMAQREVEMTSGLGDCENDDGGKKSESLRLILCIAKPGDASTQFSEESEGQPEQPASKLKAVAQNSKLKVELPHFEPSMVLEAVEKNLENSLKAKVDRIIDSDGLSLPGVELWRDSSSCVHNEEALILTESLAAVIQPEQKPLQPKVRASNLLLGVFLKESLDPGRTRHEQPVPMKELKPQETTISDEDEKMRKLQQDLMEEWKEQKARDSKGSEDSEDDIDEGGLESEKSEGAPSSGMSSDDVDESSSQENSKIESQLSAEDKDSLSLKKSNRVPLGNLKRGRGKGIGTDPQNYPDESPGINSFNAKTVLERRKELLQRLSKIQMPIVSCPAAVIGHLEDHPERLELAKELVMNLQPAEQPLVFMQDSRLAWQSLNLRRPLRLNQYRRCSRDSDTMSEDSYLN